MRHGRVRRDPDDRIWDGYTAPSGPANKVHKGLCGCGVETSRSVTLGPPGHPENGWECASCGENRLRFEMMKANNDPRRI